MGRGGLQFAAESCAGVAGEHRVPGVKTLDREQVPRPAQAFDVAEALDPAAGADLITGLLAAAAGKAALLATRQPRLVGLADQVMRLDNGRVTIERSDARLEQPTLRYQRFQWTTSSNGRRSGLAIGRSCRSAG